MWLRPEHSSWREAMPPISTALVVGAGIAGPAVAIALRKAGIEPLVFEAHDSDASGVGAF